MESENLRQRTRDEPTITDTTTPESDDSKEMKNKKAAKTEKAKRGLPSLSVAVALPLLITLATISYTGYGATYAAIKNKPFWYPPLWAIEYASVASSLLMGLSAWLVWAEGGFHDHVTWLGFYLAQFLLGLAWAPITFALGNFTLGWIVGVALLGSLFGCSQCFRKVNPIAGDLVLPCLGWVGFMSIVNFSLLYL